MFNLKGYFEKELITNEFLIVMFILLICTGVIVFKGDLPDGFREILATILVFVGRGALNKHSVKSEKEKLND